MKFSLRISLYIFFSYKNIFSYFQNWLFSSKHKIFFLFFIFFNEHFSSHLQPMKALRASAGTSQPVLTGQQVQTVFYQVPEIRDIHHGFYSGLKARLSSHCLTEGGQEEANHQGFSLMVGDLFLKMVSSTFFLFLLSILTFISQWNVCFFNVWFMFVYHSGFIILFILHIQYQSINIINSCICFATSKHAFLSLPSCLDGNGSCSWILKYFPMSRANQLLQYWMVLKQLREFSAIMRCCIILY